jgi:glycosyltransferase involved in cell wall biosynthesis
MKLALVIGTFFPATRHGGPIYATYSLSCALARVGVEVNVSTTNVNGKTRLDVPVGSFLNITPGFNVKYYGWATSTSLSLPFMVGLWKDIAACDAVFLQPLFSSYVPITLIYATLLNKPVLLSPRGSLGAWSLQNRRNILKKLWLALFIKPYLSRVFWHAVSEGERSAILAVYPDARVDVVPNGIDTSEFESPSMLSRRDFMEKFTEMPSDAQKIIISMGRLHRLKGFDILIRAFAVLKDRLPGAYLLIAGPDGGARAALEKIIQTSGLKERVFLVGEINGKDKVDFLANADIFVLPSHSESFGIVYAESLAAGTPIVASSQTPWQDIEEHNCGKWVKDTIEETAQAIHDLLSRDLVDMGRCGKKYIQDAYSWPAIALRFEKIFKQMTISD